MPSLDFVLATAFTRSQFGGNPAATIFLNADPKESSIQQQDQVQDVNWMQSVAATLNQPIASFVFPLSNPPTEDGTATVGIRWFTTGIEVPLCGHGLLVAAHLLFSGTVARPDLIPSPANVDTIHFVSGLTGNTVTARRIVHVDEQTGLKSERVEIELPMATVEPVPEPEFKRIADVVSNAVGRKLTPEMTGPVNEGQIRVRFVGKGAEGLEQKGGFEFYVLVEVECAAGESLGGLKVDTNVLKQTDPFYVNILTSRSSTPSVTYDTRMFAPRAEVHEDHVCGSANCLMAPHWAAKLYDGATENAEEKEMRVAQVSRRGGELWAIAKKTERKVLLRGEVKVFAQGKLDM